MRTAVLAVLAAAVLIVGALAWPHPADAAAPCMDRAEFTRIHKGQTVAKVRAIVGASGTVTLDDRSPGYRFLAKEYRVCGSRYGLAYVQWSTTETANGTLGVYGKGFYA